MNKAERDRLHDIKPRGYGSPLRVADFKAVRAALVNIAPDYVVDGREAIVAWFARHGWPVSWRTLLDWQKRCGEPLAFHSQSIGRHLGRPISTHHLLLAWMMSQSAKLTPAQYATWVPSPRAMRTRRAWTRLDEKRAASK